MEFPFPFEQKKIKQQDREKGWKDSRKWRQRKREWKCRDRRM